jgi:transposase
MLLRKMGNPPVRAACGPSVADGVVTTSPAQLGYLLSGIDWRHPQESWRPTSMG